MRIEKILVPVDFSAHTSAAIRAACELAQRHHASLTLLHVWGPVAYALPEGFLFYTPEQLSRMYSECQALLAAGKAEAEKAGAAQVQVLLREGVVASEISAVARSGRYDLIVIGSHGRTGIRHALVGSIAEKVAREAPCAVMIVKAPPAMGASASSTDLSAIEQGMRLDAIYQRRATRSYLPERVSDAAIRALLDAAVRAPTAMHLEPWAFAIVQDRERLKKLSDRAKELAPPEHRAAFDSPDFNIFYDAGTLIVICGHGAGPFVEADCWLAAENLMLAACARGLGTCPIGFALPALHLPEVKDALGIPAGVTAIAPIIVGFPRGAVVDSGRKPPEILRWIKPVAVEQ